MCIVIPSSLGQYSAIFLPATPDWGYQSRYAYRLCLEHRGFLSVVHGELAPRRLEHRGAYRSRLRIVLPAGCGVRLEHWSCAHQTPKQPNRVWVYVYMGVWVYVRVCVCVYMCVYMCGPTIFVENQQKHQHEVGNFLNTFENPIYTRPKMEPRQATLREMGLRTEKSIALHILQENTYESNLVSDIANAPYLRGNTGRTHLAPLPGLPPFVDDIYMYVYGRLEEKDTVRVGARLSCTTGPNGAAARTVSQISLFARAVWPPEEHKWIHVSIANTVATNSGTRIPQTIEGIEEEDEGRLANTWAAIHGGARAAAYFVAKLDVSELPFEALQAGLPQLQRQLVANGMALYKSTTHRTSRAPWIGRSWSDTWRRRTTSATRASPPKRTRRAVFWTTLTPLATTFALLYGVQANERYRTSSTTRWWRKSRRATCGASLEAICRALWPAPTSIFGELWPTRMFWRVAAQGWRFPYTAALWKSWTQGKQAPCSRTLCAWRHRKGRT